MTKSTSLTNSQNRGDGCSKLMTCENGGATPWSDLNHHLLYQVLMKLEVIDFFPFSGVCKSWRSLTLPNKSKFMASRPPMAISISTCSNKKEYWLEDSEGKKSKLPFPQFDCTRCVGLTCGYLVLYGEKTCDFCLVNPVTRHELHFPKLPRHLDCGGARAILVFSHSASAWVSVVLCRYFSKIWYSIAGTQEWNYISPEYAILDIHEFKGKIYAMNTRFGLCELGLDPEPKLTLLETKNYVESEHRYMPSLFVEFVCSGEKLHAMKCFSEKSYEIRELDFGEMNWVSPKEKTMEEHALFRSKLKHSALIKRKLLPYSVTSGNRVIFTAVIWYFAHDCLKVNLKHE